jgi:hypothetical protein
VHFWKFLLLHLRLLFNVSGLVVVGGSNDFFFTGGGKLV